jgi:hypothetical protein
LLKRAVVAEAGRKLSEELRSAGVSGLREDSMWIQDVSQIQGKVPQVVVSFSSIYWAQQVLDPGVRDKLKQKGITFSVNLTPAEMANRRLIQQHPQFQAAVKRMPAGAKVMWRLDACVIDSKWNAKSEVWTIDRLTASDRMEVDMTAE